MKRIIVYADFDFLSAPQEVGTLGYEHVRGKDHLFTRTAVFIIVSPPFVEQDVYTSPDIWCGHSPMC